MAALFHSREKAAIAAAIREDLARAKRLREAGRRAGDDRLRLREWQAARLARTYPDLLASPRYGRAARFFLDELYGPKDFTERDDEVARILPTMTRLLPVAAVRAFALAVELDCVSETLDAALVAALRAGGNADAALRLDAPRYADAYRRCANRAERERQIRLVREIGEALDALARKPLVAKAVEMMRRPAALAGLAELHAFLEGGFAAFRHMQGADEFLGTIDRRERRIMERLFAGDPDPFAPVDRAGR
ncbi:MAG: hypothetical protein KJ025_20055 [Burkholderiales bacterium]|nr:hypothetical protein [Burkholderiales bacterium]